MMKKNGKKRVLRIRSVEINVTALIVCLLAADLLIAAAVLYGCAGKKAQPNPTGPVLTAIPSVNAPATAQPNPTSAPAPEEKHEHPLLNVRYEKTTFEPTVDLLTGFASAWHAAGDSSGYVETAAVYDTVSASVYTPGNAPASAIVSQEGIPFENGKSYGIYIHGSCDQGGSINIVASNGDTGEEYGRITVNLTPELTYFEFPFTVNGNGTYNGRVSFEMGGGMVPANGVVTLNGLRILGDFGSSMYLIKEKEE